MRKHYHFIGIGGVGMSALAQILLSRGEKVTGSDLALSSKTKKLEKAGAQIFPTHDSKWVKRADFVIYSTNIPEGNPERMAAEKKGIPLLHRSELMKQLMQGYAPLLITGTHGKTTTSGLVAHSLMQAGLDLAYAIGGYLKGIEANGREGKGVYFVAEADESDGSFLRYVGFGAIITNLGLDHMEYWETEEALQKAFLQFASQIASKEHFFWCYDDPRLLALGLMGYSYGFDEKADVVISDFVQKGWRSVFTLSFMGKTYSKLDIPLIGKHNVSNAAAAFVLGIKLDISEETLREAMSSFPGVRRRVEKKGEALAIEVYDDYAHHPTEVFATLQALRSVHDDRRIVVVFQPHRYTRTQFHLEDFAQAFCVADSVIVTDIFSAQEKQIPGISPKTLEKKVKEKGMQSVRYVDKESLCTFLATHVQEGDLVITMGAGDITQIGPAFLEHLRG